MNRVPSHSLGPQASGLPAQRLRLVVLESPFSGDVEANVRFARQCLRDCLARGEAPIASHLLFTQPGVLDDEKPEERALGMEAGFAWGVKADACVVYRDRGVSGGMLEGIKRAERAGIPVEYRELCGWCADGYPLYRDPDGRQRHNLPEPVSDAPCACPAEPTPTEDGPVSLRGEKP